MTIEYTGRKTTVTPKLRTQAHAGLIRIEKVTNRCTSAHVILSEEKHRKIAEVTVQCRGERIVARAEATDMDCALHDALKKVEQQAIAHKDRFVSLHQHRQHAKPVSAVLLEQTA